MHVPQKSDGAKCKRKTILMKVGIPIVRSNCTRRFRVKLFMVPPSGMQGKQKLKTPLFFGNGNAIEWLSSKKQSRVCAMMTFEGSL